MACDKQAIYHTALQPHGSQATASSKITARSGDEATDKARIFRPCRGKDRELAVGGGHGRWNHRDVTRRTRPEGLRRGRELEIKGKTAGALEGRGWKRPNWGRGCRGDAKKIWGLSETIFRQRKLQRGGIETGSAPAGSGKLRSSPRTGRPLETSG